MSNNIEKLKKEAHFIQGELNPNFENIFKTLQENELLDKSIKISEWKENIEVILEKLNEIKDASGEIKLKYVGKFDINQGNPDSYVVRKFDVDFERELERYSRINEGADFKENEGYIMENKDLYFSIYKKESILNQSILLDFIENRFLSRRGRFDKFVKVYYRLIDLFVVSNDELFIINKNLSNKINNKYVSIEIELSVYELVNGLIGKISILNGFYQKESFIEKFETRKKLKEKESEKYFLIGICIFSSIVIGNIVMFCLNKDNSFGLAEFGKNFLGKNIYIFSIEIIGFILAFYFLWLFKVYKKVIELYDSHILLIESDDYYKNDAYFMASNSEKILEMRKENAQKIHDLPGKIFDIFNGKDSFTSDLPVGKALDIINNLTKK